MLDTFDTELSLLADMLLIWEQQDGYVLYFIWIHEEWSSFLDSTYFSYKNALFCFAEPWMVEIRMTKKNSIAYLPASENLFFSMRKCL